MRLTFTFVEDVLKPIFLKEPFPRLTATSNRTPGGLGSPLAHQSTTFFFECRHSCGLVGRPGLTGVPPSTVQVPVVERPARSVVVTARVVSPYGSSRSKTADPSGALNPAWSTGLSDPSASP